MIARRLLWLVAVALIGCAGPHPRPMRQGISYTGMWDSTWGRMEINQKGKHVWGTFSGFREGSVSGDLDGDVLHFVWDQMVPRSHGRGYFQISPDGLHLEGRWGYYKSPRDGGRWAADRDTARE